MIGYEEPLTKAMHLVLERNMRVAIKGVNGLGKTTLLKTLMGRIPGVSGSVEVDPYASIGFFEQEEAGESMSALDYFWKEYPAMTNGEVRAALAKCGLTTDHIESGMCVLSGGEQAKIRLCVLMNREHNVLVLDEPTNHLDVDAKEELKRALKATRERFFWFPMTRISMAILWMRFGIWRNGRQKFCKAFDDVYSLVL